jgi:NADH-quinone oxidoreductase subunit L
MEGPTPVSALIHAATMVNAGVYLLARVHPIFAVSPIWLTVVLWVGIVSAVLAASVASVTLDLKRVLAYSTISQLGLMFAALGLGSPEGWFASQFHLVSQGLFKALGFLAAGMVIHALGTRNMDELGGLRSSLRGAYLGFLWSSLAMAGVPPLVGFWSKDSIVGAVVAQQGYAAAAAILLASALTAYYSFRALFKTFHGRASPVPSTARGAFLPMQGPILLLMVGVAVPWLQLGSLSFALEEFEVPLSAAVVGGSLATLAGGLGLSYAVYIRGTPNVRTILLQHPVLASWRSVMLGGYGFDAAYGRFATGITRRASAALRHLQTGWTGINLLLLALFVVLLVAFVVVAGR